MKILEIRDQVLVRGQVIVVIGDVLPDGLETGATDPMNRVRIREREVAERASGSADTPAHSHVDTVS